MTNDPSTSPSFFVTVREAFRHARVHLVITLYVFLVLSVTAIHYHMAWKFPGNFGPTVELTLDAEGQLTGRSIEAIPQPKPVGSLVALLLLLPLLIVAASLFIRLYFTRRPELLGRIGYPIISGCLAIITLLLPWAILGGDNFKTCVDSLLTCLYFNVAVATTTGFGDIYPQSTAARLTVMVEVMSSVALLSLVLSLFFATAGRRRVGPSQEV